MNNSGDDLIWETIGEDQFCSFKWKTSEQNFCKNEFNLTGFCSRQSCPLANSKYATIIERNGQFFLYQKEERYSNLPEMIWKKTILSRNFIKAVQQIDFKLAFWPKFFVFRAKQKLTKLTQKLIRERIVKIRSEDVLKKDQLFHLRKTNQEFKGISKIKLEKVIQHELMNRFNLGVYGKLYRLPPIQEWRKFQKVQPEQKTNSSIIQEASTI